jgi:hypothetical protein
MNRNEWIDIALPAIVALCCLVVLFSYLMVAHGDNIPSTLNIQISNPYSFDVDAEVKCDWNDEKQEFNFYKRFIFPADQITKIEIPKAKRQCEVWPHVQLFE